MPDILKIYQILKKRYGLEPAPLIHETAEQLAIAVILSAQCTDERVNKTTPALFKRFPTIHDFAQADISELEKFIFSTGFYHNKAKNIKTLAETLIRNYEGKIPENMDDLIKLPGIGRKTANVILNQAFDKSEGIVVDTHVARITRLWEFHNSENPVIIEKKLMQEWPKAIWHDLPLWIIFLGREFCIARKPRCQNCIVRNQCPAAKD